MKHAGVAIALMLSAWAVAVTAGSQQPVAEGWHAFEASWSATGERHTLAVEDGQTAAIVWLSGALVLRTGDGLSRGFRAEVLGFDGGRGEGVGRAVWTDAEGDRIFSTLAEPPAQSSRQLNGTITGGTGRYAGITGSYSFMWNYVLPADEGRIQATAVSINGRYRREGGR